MAMLSDDSPVRAQILPSIWRGYKTPRSKIMGETLPFKEMISTKENVPQEWLDEMFNAFQNGSLADFYDKYLGKTLTEKDHEFILLKADKILKKGLDAITPTDDPLLTIAAVDIANNADEYGHHLFQTACFLSEQNQLPKEARVIFWRKINPALYSEKEEFEKVEKALLEPLQKVPMKWAQNSFFCWLQKDDSRAYLSHMKEIAALEFILANKGHDPVERAVRNYIHEHREPAYKHRPRPARRGWRVYGG